MRRTDRTRSPLRELPDLDESASPTKAATVDETKEDAYLACLSSYDTELAWLDDILSPPSASSKGPSASPSLAVLDGRVSQLVSQLDLATSDTAHLVATTIDDVARTVPRLALDLQLMRENAVLLGYGLQTVRQKTTGEKVMTNSTDEGEEAKTDEIAVLEKLRLLDLMRTRMDSARSVLREAESWSTLDSDIRAHLAMATAAAATPAKPFLPAATDESASSPYRLAALRLAEASRSLAVFISSPEYPSRSALLRSLTDDLEAAICPVLVNAVSTRADHEVLALKEVFALVGRGGREFQSWYWAGRRESIANTWSGVELVDAPSTQSGRSAHEVAMERPMVLSDFLGDKFFPFLLNVVLDEIQHLALVFQPPSRRAISPDPPPTPSAAVHSPFFHRSLLEPHPLKGGLPATPTRSAVVVLTTFLASTLEALSPSLSTRLSASVSNNSQPSLGLSPLEELIKSWKAVQAFAVQFERCVGKLETLIALEAGLPASGGGTSMLAGNQLVPSPSPSPMSPSIPNAPSGEGSSISSTSGGATSSSTNIALTSTTTKRDRRSRRLSFSRRTSGRKFSISGGIAATAAAIGDDGALLLPAEPPSAGLSNLKRASSTPAAEPVREWEAALFEPFLELQMAYHSLEQSHLSALLSSHLRSHLPAHRSSILLTGRQLTDALSPILLWADAAWDRCLTLTHGYGALGCIRAVDGMIQEFLSRGKQVVEDMKVSAEEARGGKKRHEAGGGDELLGAGEATDLEGLEYSSRDWEVLQLGLRLLEGCRTISDRVAALDARFKAKLAGMASTLKEGHLPPSGTTQGAITLLRQSALNSGELALLLDAVSGAASVAESRKVSGPSHAAPDEERSPRPAHPVHTRHSRSFSISGLPAPALRSKENSVEQPALLLGHARAGVTALTRGCQQLVHSTILAPLMAQLALYPSLSVWTATAADVKAQSSSVAAITDMQMPKFSLSPTEAISRVGEGLFNLPRLFDVYAADDALTFSIETLPFVDPDALLRSFGVEPLPSPPLALRPARRSGLLDVDPGNKRRGSSRNRSVSPSKASVRPPASLPNLSAETVISTWISSLALSVISNLTLHILPALPRLSAHGAAQIASDLAHISNVAEALEAQGDDLERWREACEMDAAEGKRRLAEGEGADEIFAKVAKLRGWTR